MRFSPALARFTACCLAFLLFPLAAGAQETSRARVGHEYRLIDLQPAGAGDAVEVIEFFWYGCPHCYSLEPALESWVKKLPPDAQFKRVPAILSDSWVPHARLYYAFEALGVLERVHRPFFDAIHKDRLNVASEGAMNEWLQKNGIDRKKLDDALKSFGVQAKVKRAAQLSSAYRVDGVPMLAVHGKFTVSAEQGRNPNRMLANAEQLIDIARKDLTKK